MVLTVGTVFQEAHDDLKLELLAGAEGLARPVPAYEVNRPGLAFTGYFEHFPSGRVQIIGLGELSYLQSLAPEQRRGILDRFLSYNDLPCAIIARGLEAPADIVAAFADRKIPLLRSALRTSRLMGELIYFLQDRMLPSTRMHGVLVNVYGLGVLITGMAGIGKSECALELVKRGHMLVADDVVEISQRSGGILIGRGEPSIRHHMEIRGLGIVDVARLFGIGYIFDETRIGLVIRLQEWTAATDYERIGLDEHFTTIMEVRVPEVTLPVGPGRNLAVLVEIASLNQRLKNKGYYAAREFNKRLITAMNKERI